MTWQKIEVNKEVIRRFTHDELGNIYCIYSPKVETVNGAGILKSIDGGQTWNDITPRTQIIDKFANMEDIKFANGWLIATIRRYSSELNGRIIRSADRGVTWSSYTTLSDYKYVDPYRLEYIGGDTWICTEVNGWDSFASVLKSGDNGVSWVRKKSSARRR